MPDEIIGRAEARAKGLITYFTGKPCKRGHVEPRTVCDCACRRCSREKVSAQRAANPEVFRIRDKKSYDKHREKRIAKSRRWNIEHSDEVKKRSQTERYRIKGRAATSRWKQTHRDEVNAYRRALSESDVGFRLRINLAGRINQAVRYVWGHKSARTLELIGCSIEELRAHLERQFLPGMTWKNYGYGNDKWHIDHVRPCATFDLIDPDQQRACFHFSNLQPLWQPDNFRKNKRVEVSYGEAAQL